MKRIANWIDTMVISRILAVIGLTVIILSGGVAPVAAGPVGFSFLPVRHIRDIEGDFNQPTEVVVSNTGQIYVLDGANNKIKIFNRRGAMVRSFGRPGQGPGEFQQPVGMDVDASEHIYVADTGNQRIQVFDRDGGFLRLFDLADRDARPVEVKLGQPADRIYISDTRNHQILCYHQDGTFAFAWGAHGKMLGEFMFPGMADTDAAGNIHVVDILNGRVQIFDATGKNPRQVAGFGIRPGTLFRPKGIVIDHDSRIYVSDSYTGVIQVFAPSGNLHAILSADGTSPLRLTTPLGLAMDTATDQLYVVQAEANKISVFELRGGL
jgi:DNA-binding beta-propeller fold protein YncE